MEKNNLNSIHESLEREKENFKKLPDKEFTIKDAAKILKYSITHTETIIENMFEGGMLIKIGKLGNKNLYKKVENYEL